MVNSLSGSGKGKLAKKRIEWGSQIRSYVMQPYRLVKDLRTGVEVGDTDRVFNGDLMPFMEAWLAQRADQAAAGELVEE